MTPEPPTPMGMFFSLLSAQKWPYLIGMPICLFSICLHYNVSAGGQGSVSSRLWFPMTDLVNMLWNMNEGAIFPMSLAWVTRKWSLKFIYLEHYKDQVSPWKVPLRRYLCAPETQHIFPLFSQLLSLKYKESSKRNNFSFTDRRQSTCLFHHHVLWVCPLSWHLFLKGKHHGWSWEATQSNHKLS